MATSNQHASHIRSTGPWVLLLLVCMCLTFLSDNPTGLRVLIQKSKPAETTETTAAAAAPALTGGSSRIPNKSNSNSSSFYECQREHNIGISQHSADPLPDGTLVFTVQIINTCTYGCSMKDIHVHCGSFVSTELFIDPSIFRRIAYDDCLVNDGKVLTAGNTVSFQYSNSLEFPLTRPSFNCITTASNETVR